MSVDLGGLAKGWTLDRLGELVARRRLRARVLLDFGGSSLTRSAPRTMHPLGESKRRVGEILALADADLSLSSSFGAGRCEIGGSALGTSSIRAPANRFASSATPPCAPPSGAIAEAWSKAFGRARKNGNRGRHRLRFRDPRGRWTSQGTTTTSRPSDLLLVTGASFVSSPLRSRGSRCAAVRAPLRSTTARSIRRPRRRRVRAARGTHLARAFDLSELVGAPRRTRRSRRRTARRGSARAARRSEPRRRGRARSRRSASSTSITTTSTTTSRSSSCAASASRSCAAMASRSPSCVGRTKTSYAR